MRAVPTPARACCTAAALERSAACALSRSRATPAARDELARALGGDVGVGGVRLRLRERGLGAIERRAQRRRVDLEQRCPCLTSSPPCRDA